MGVVLRPISAPATIYSAPTWEFIFSRHWVFAAFEGEIPEAGDYVTVTFGRYSIIIVRDDDGSINAFHNVCRHWGSRILDDKQGSVGNLVCPAAVRAQRIGPTHPGMHRDPADRPLNQHSGHDGRNPGQHPPDHKISD